MHSTSTRAASIIKRDKSLREARTAAETKWQELL